MPDSIKEKAKDCIKTFKDNPFNESLETHKLKGRLKGLWAFSINKKYKIIFEFNNNKQIAYFHTTGDHSYL
ncbi:MAG: type II toxin-antitoxin system RelE/ParE family toxin [Candidatus Magasanikbacteria bacterium]